MSHAVVEQHEKAYQKQGHVFLGDRKLLTERKRKGNMKGNRWTRQVGLNYKTPKEAIEGKYIDKKCPFTGNVSIRGRIIQGVVKSTKMKRTIVVRRDYLHYITKYNRFEKRHRNIPAHCSPAFRVKEGDYVTIGQCRPLSKTVRFNVIRIDREAGGDKKQFAGF